MITIHFICLDKQKSKKLEIYFFVLLELLFVLKSLSMIFV